MKQLRNLGVGLMLAGCVGSAQAGLIQFSETLTKVGNLSGNPASRSYIHDLAGVSPTPFDSELHDFVSGTLELTLSVPSNDGVAISDMISVSLEGDFADAGKASELNDTVLDISGFFIPDLGSLSVDLTRVLHQGNIVLEKSILTVYARERIVNGEDDSVIAVPAPGTLALLGVGLLGSQLLVRRRGAAVKG
ncbi:PEP-CTERM sorting domain-containing protein [Haliea sp. E1-2-M8]|uniref:PEP-CTERM sorting domain-containing protein n=1 Tax=Haliea sp. E1-2-M8 TaxID=3064706 RepID=UPI002724D118|nr:PEP-CTERM sorting domain-containing protein [Haliea sp. E1-2-M8]MDO8861315.1 PEP-CTERM sorting domain-containing protein [Haliea sp. E1-2-M8]